METLPTDPATSMVRGGEFVLDRGGVLSGSRNGVHPGVQAGPLDRRPESLDRPGRRVDRNPPISLHQLRVVDDVDQIALASVGDPRRGETSQELRTVQPVSDASIWASSSAR